MEAVPVGPRIGASCQQPSHLSALADTAADLPKLVTLHKHGM
jgi:hypothetical protein